MPLLKKSKSQYLTAARQHLPGMLQQLEALVTTESPSENKAAVNRASHLVAGWLQALGGKVRWHKQQKFGDLLEVRFGAVHAGTKPYRGKIAKPVLLLGHLDTVWPIGTPATMPFRVVKGQALEPGIFDMKAGVVMAVHALAMLREMEAAHGPV